MKPKKWNERFTAELQGMTDRELEATWREFCVDQRGWRRIGKKAGRDAMLKVKIIEEVAATRGVNLLR